MALGCLPDDGEPETGTRHHPGVGGPVEPLEDQRQVGLGHPWPLVGHRELAAMQRDPHRAAGRAPLGRVVEQVRDGALEDLCLTDDPPGRAPGCRTRPRGRVAVPGRRRARRCRRGRAAREFATSGSSRASSTRSPTRVESSSTWAVTSSKISCRELSAIPPRLSACASSSRLVRRLVSGVRSSCPASATSRRCRSRERCRARSMSLNDAARLASSSSPVIGIGFSSSVRAMCSAAALSWRTGSSADLATASPISPAAMIPPPPTRAAPGRPGRWCSRSTPVDWVNISAVPSPRRPYRHGAVVDAVLVDGPEGVARACRAATALLAATERPDLAPLR